MVLLHITFAESRRLLVV